MWMEGKSLAVWHDGASVRDFRKRRKTATVNEKAARVSADKNQKMAGVLYEEQQESKEISGNLIDLFKSRVKYFGTSFPFLGHSYPDLHLVIDREQWAGNILNFNIGLYINTGTLIDTQPCCFNGSIQTVNLNVLFAEQLQEISQGYFTVTADPRDQGDEQEPGDLQYPSDSMLFAFWSDGVRVYDSVHSLDSWNLVAFDLGDSPRGKSEMAKATKRIVSRTKKFAPFVASDKQRSWYWVCNAGMSEEKIDTDVKFRLYGPDGLEEIVSFNLPSNCARIVSAHEILRECNATCSWGTLWVESNDCNLGALWFMDTGDGKGFATDHFTGG